nr:MAG TPA: Proline/betaine transporter, CYTOPLASMIC, COILED-COIL, ANTIPARALLEL, TWO-STRANDED [Caudoviricetes sp.]
MKQNNQAEICRKIGIIVGSLLNICVTLVLALVKAVSSEAKNVSKGFDEAEEVTSENTKSVETENEVNDIDAEIERLMALKQAKESNNN